MPYAWLSLGGLVGYISYDFVRKLEKKVVSTNAPSGFPLFEFGMYKDFIRVDNESNEIDYISLGEDRFSAFENLLRAPADSKELKLGDFKCNLTREQFEKNVDACKDYLTKGHIIQAVISKQYSAGFEGDLYKVYPILRSLNPSPYMYCLEFFSEAGGRKIIGSSPENLIRIENGYIDSFATLAGTRPRGRNAEEDTLLENELKNDEKEIAEHVMLVDLTRNDLGRVAEYGSVKVLESFQIKKFSHVQHLSSHISARLAPGRTNLDALGSIFPAGTLSGAPKIRAMQIIEELEPNSRGPYGGAVGYLSLNGNIDFGICIRSVCSNGNKLYVQSGAGIVYDSKPDKEFEETENKARAVVNALKIASSK